MTSNQIRLTSAELGNLWECYMSGSLAVCTLSYFREVVQDADIYPVIEDALGVLQLRLADVRTLFSGEQMAIPHAFSVQEDVNLKAARLYSDSYFLYYIHSFAMLGMANFAKSLASSARQDVRKFFERALIDSTEKYNRTTDLLLVKGLYTRQPYIPVPKQVQFAKSDDFLGGLFNKKRPLNAPEITALWRNILTNTLGKALLTGFAQVAGTPDVREILFRGSRISKKHIELFGAKLLEEDISAPMTWDTEVTDSTEAPFSDKLMMFHTLKLVSSGLGNYGVAIAECARRDLSLTYSRLMFEIGQYADDLTKLMIEQGWLELPPQTKSREQLARQ
ncbi:MAG TPA: DUF3231 family protein [Bacilli bacterium]|nr:DUF3231 family protein [Bacilli bacterium]